MSLWTQAGLKWTGDQVFRAWSRVNGTSPLWFQELPLWAPNGEFYNDSLQRKNISRQNKAGIRSLKHRQGHHETCRPTHLEPTICLVQIQWKCKKTRISMDSQTLKTKCYILKPWGELIGDVLLVWSFHRQKWYWNSEFSFSLIIINVRAIELFRIWIIKMKTESVLQIYVHF